MCLAAVYKAQDPETKLFLEGTIVMVDLANSIVKINCTES